MDNRFKSILDELGSYVPDHNKEAAIEGRALQVIASARNLIKLVEANFPPEISEDLTKRLLSAIKNDDSEKFCRRIRKVGQLREQKDVKKNQ